MISDITMQGDSARMSVQEVSDRLGDAFYDVDVLGRVLPYLGAWARIGDPPCPAGWHDPDAWEANVDTFMGDTAIEYAVASTGVRACVQQCRPGVQGLLSALRAGTRESAKMTAHERLWVALEELGATLPNDDLVGHIWECEDVWHQVWPDVVEQCLKAEAINRLVPPHGLDDLRRAYYEEYARLVLPEVVDHDAWPSAHVYRFAVAARDPRRLVKHLRAQGLGGTITPGLIGFTPRWGREKAVGVETAHHDEALVFRAVSGYLAKAAEECAYFTVDGGPGRLLHADGRVGPL